MPITRASLAKTTSKKPKKKYMTPGAKARAKADKNKKAILSQQRGEASPKGGKVVMRGFVKALYDKVKNKK